MEKKITEVSVEEMEKVTGGAGGPGGGRSVLNGPFCLACGSALTFANGSYKCMKIGCSMEGDPQEGYYKRSPRTGM